MRIVKLTSLAAATALAFGAGALVATPAHAQDVSTVIDGVTYVADDSDVLAGAAATDFDHSTTSVTIPDNVEIDGTTYAVVAVGDSAFVKKNHDGHILNGDITSVVIGDNVKVINRQAFGSNKINSLTLGSSLQTIRQLAFMTNSLTEVTIPENVATIEGWAFNENPDLTSVIFTGPAPAVITEAGGSSSFDNSAPGFMISYPEQFGSDDPDTGYTTPKWEGYPTQAIAGEEFSISKTVDASFVRVYDWDLEKTGTVAEIRVGDDDAAADVDFTVTATPKSYVDMYYVLSGVITVTNETVEPRTVSVADEPNIGVDASCVVETSTGISADDFTLPANESAQLPYYCTFEGVPEDDTNTATISWGNGSSNSVTEDVVFTQRDTSFYWVTVGDDHANPESGYSELVINGWNSQSAAYDENYTVTFENLPLDECTAVTNTAIIFEMERTAEATVEICPESVADTPEPDGTPDKQPVLIPDQTPEPGATPAQTPESAGLAQTGSQISAGGLTIAALLLLAGGTALIRSRRVRA
ncbi:MAG: leucine-rich repeat protein [Canibacter sp.]